MLMFYLSLLDEQYHPIFLEFHARYERRLYAVALGILKKHAMAEDAVSASMIKIIEHFDQFLKIYNRARSEIGPWAVTIVKNTALDLLRKEGRSGNLDEDWDAPAPEDTEGETSYRRLVDIIAAMPLSYRQVLDLRLVGEWSIKEIARATGLSEAAVRGRVKRGLELLREELEKEGYAYDRR